MPWRRRRYNYWRRPRYRWWRPRTTFRRRRRYRKHRVRRFLKLKRLTLKQWQPSKIRTCKIKGIMCLFLCNAYRLGHNLPIYNQSIVPEKLPGGGGFSLYQFTFDNLYTMHEYCRNWWTTSNKKLPLIRYIKCVAKIYQSHDVDIAFRYQIDPPLINTQLSYPSTQPSMMMMLNNTILIPSKQTKQLRKQYKKITIPPPKLMQNKWFFQKDLATQPLLLTQCVACSFDNYYISTQNMSNNCTVPCLNTNIFENRNFTQKPYYWAKQQGTQYVYLWASYSIHAISGQPKSGEVILLTNTTKYFEGYDYNTYLTHASIQNKSWQEFKEHIQIYAGNPFHDHYLNTDGEHYHSLTLYQSIGTEDPTTHLGTDQNQPTIGLVVIHNPFIYNLRYNPNADNGKTNSTYLLQNFKPQTGWNPPSDHKLILEGFPLYINLWGFADFQKQQHILTNIDTATILTIQTNTLHGAPNQLPAFVPLNSDFITGNSPFEKGVNPVDSNRWYPMLQYQEKTVNDILSTGPGTAKLDSKKTVEAKMEYIFYFKFGGSPAPMVELTDPTEQTKFPIINNLMQTNSLQNPTTPPELFLYNFDQRRDLLTKQATERIGKDWETKKTIFSDGTTTPAAPAILQTPQTSDQETSDSEKEETTLFEKLLKQRRKQQILKQRLRQLLITQQLTTQNIE
nr:MAG: ORF1 [TTV-like mini virus]